MDLISIDSKIEPLHYDRKGKKTMPLPEIQTILIYIQQGISIAGILIILSGVILASIQYFLYFFTRSWQNEGVSINTIRLNFGRILILGLECIVAADLIRTTTTPDYYALGILAIIVMIRTLLSFSLNRELIALNQEK